MRRVKHFGSKCTRDGKSILPPVLITELTHHEAVWVTGSLDIGVIAGQGSDEMDHPKGSHIFNP